jgi:hypothetical protein
MRYRDARLLIKGDKITRIYDHAVLTVDFIEAFGQYKKVKIHCFEPGSTTLISVFNDEVEE